MLCARCQAEGHWTQIVAAILLYAPGLRRPYVLIPGEDYRVCLGCDAMTTFVTKAQAANPNTASSGAWTRALVVTIDGEGYDVHDKYATQPAAKA